MSVDAKKILDYFGVEYVTNHPKVTKKCVGVDCPFCDDHNKHLGVFLNGKGFSCWKCGTHGSLFDLLKKIKDISWKEFKQFSPDKTYREGGVMQNLDNIFDPPIPIQSVAESGITMPPDGCIRVQDSMPPTIQKQIDKFLDERNFPFDLLRMHKCYYGVSGYFAGRLVIPIFYLGEVVGLCGRDLTGIGKPKYLFNKGFNRNNHVYIAHTFPGTTPVLVEGIFDAWRVSQIHGFMGIAIFGTSISTTQIKRLVTLQSNEVVICLDGDAKRKARHVAGEVIPFFQRTSLVTLSEDEDPCSIGVKKLTTLINQALWK